MPLGRAGCARHWEMPAGISHEVVVTLPGYANWTKSVSADAGRKLSLDAKMQVVLARVSIQGEPADAELLIDGKPRGRTPQAFAEYIADPDTRRLQKREAFVGFGDRGGRLRLGQGSVLAKLPDRLGDVPNEGFA